MQKPSTKMQFPNLNTSAPFFHTYLRIQWLHRFSQWLIKLKNLLSSIKHTNFNSWTTCSSFKAVSCPGISRPQEITPMQFPQKRFQPMNCSWLHKNERKTLCMVWDAGSTTLLKAHFLLSQIRCSRALLYALRNVFTTFTLSSILHNFSTDFKVSATMCVLLIDHSFFEIFKKSHGSFKMAGSPKLCYKPSRWLYKWWNWETPSYPDPNRHDLQVKAEHFWE